MPNRGATFMDRRRETMEVRLLEPLNVLPRYAEHLRNLGHTYKVRSDLDERRPRDCFFDGRKCAENRFFRRVRVTRKVQCDTSRLSGADQSIITTGFAEPLDELVDIGVISHFVFQPKRVFHHLLVSAPAHVVK